MTSTTTTTTSTRIYHVDVIACSPLSLSPSSISPCSLLPQALVEERVFKEVRNVQAELYSLRGNLDLDDRVGLRLFRTPLRLLG